MMMMMMIIIILPYFNCFFYRVALTYMGAIIISFLILMPLSSAKASSLLPTKLTTLVLPQQIQITESHILKR
jgi:hypothetical protein